MKTVDLHRDLSTCRFTTLHYAGVFARDEIPYSIMKRPLGIVVNTDPSSKPGKHWVAIFIDKSGHGYYFDSYGLPPIHKEIMDFLKNNSRLYCFNPFRVQGDDETCGYFCLYFLVMMSKQNQLHFGKDLNENDRWIRRWYQQVFQ